MIKPRIDNAFCMLIRGFITWPTICEINPFITWNVSVRFYLSLHRVLVGLVSDSELQVIARGLHAYKITEWTRDVALSYPMTL